MPTSNTPITGNESLWGNVPIDPSTVALINDSPLLVQELNEYQSEIDAGTALPIHVNSQITDNPNGIGNDANLLQTVSVSNGSQTQLQIQMGLLTGSETSNSFIGDLSYELGHVVNYSGDVNLFNNVLNPNDPNSPAIAGIFGVVTESESEANNYLIQQQIEVSTGNAVAIKLNGDSNSGGQLQATLDSAYADLSNEMDSGQQLAALTSSITGIMGTVPFLGAPSLYDYYVDNLLGVYEYTNPGTAVPSVSSGLQGAEDNNLDIYGSVTEIQFSGVPSSNSSYFATIDYSSGEYEILNFNGSQLSSVTLNASWGMLADMVYSYSPDGDYGVKVASNINSDYGGETDEFYSNGSFTISTLSSDTFLVTNTNYNAQGLPVSGTVTNIDGDDVADYKVYDPNTGLISQDTAYYSATTAGSTEPILSVTGYTNGSESNYTEYNIDGAPIESATYNPATGQRTNYVEYDNGSPSVSETGDADGYNLTYYNPDGSLNSEIVEDIYGIGTQETNYYAGTNLVSSVTNNSISIDSSDGTWSITSQDVTHYDTNGNEFEEDETQGDTTIISDFNPGQNNAYSESTYVDGTLSEKDAFNPDSGDITESQYYTNGVMSEQDTFDPNTGIVTQIQLFDGSSPYAAEIETLDPQTGQVTSTSIYDPDTGELTDYTGPGGDGGGGGSGDPGDGDGGASGDPGDGGDGGDGGGGDEDEIESIRTAGGQGTGAIAQTTAANGNQDGNSSTGEPAVAQASSASAIAKTGADSSELADAKWSSPVVTWNFAAPSGEEDSTDLVYEAQMQQAFAAWSAASGLTFEEVSNPSQADIQIGFGDLSTASNAVVGSVSGQAQNGYITGAGIELEDPTKDALVPGSGGQLTYSGTDATFEQVLLHEIGYGLGLVDSTDPTSITYNSLSAENRTLNGTDIVGIHALYGSGSSSSVIGGQIEQLIQAMAAYSPMASGMVDPMAPPTSNPQPLLMASAH
jgi:hypothetical protein